VTAAQMLPEKAGSLQEPVRRAASSERQDTRGVSARKRPCVPQTLL